MSPWDQAVGELLRDHVDDGPKTCSLRSEAWSGRSPCAALQRGVTYLGVGSRRLEN
jgi:hypothetical protein